MSGIKYKITWQLPPLSMSDTAFHNSCKFSSDSILHDFFIECLIKKSETHCGTRLLQLTQRSPLFYVVHSISNGKMSQLQQLPYFGRSTSRNFFRWHFKNKKMKDQLSVTPPPEYPVFPLKKNRTFELPMIFSWLTFTCVFFAVHLREKSATHCRTRVEQLTRQSPLFHGVHGISYGKMSQLQQMPLISRFISWLKFSSLNTCKKKRLEHLTFTAPRGHPLYLI